MKTRIKLSSFPPPSPRTKATRPRINESFLVVFPRLPNRAPHCLLCMVHASSSLLTVKVESCLLYPCFLSTLSNRDANANPPKVVFKNFVRCRKMFFVSDGREKKTNRSSSAVLQYTALQRNTPQTLFDRSIDRAAANEQYTRQQ